MTLTYDAARELIRRGRDGYRRLGNNTYLHPDGADSYAVRYHSTNVVTIHPDGTYTLNTDGWNTVTTKDRIRRYSPARVGSEGGEWTIWHSSDPRTGPKIRPCRKCRGVGRVRQPGHRDYWEYDGSWNYKRIFPPVITMPRWVRCWSCDGTGQRDYGSKPMPVIFFDGIRVDSGGCVVGADQLARLHEPAEVMLARLEVQLKAARTAWFREHGLHPRNGEVRLFKAVDDDLMSANGAHYPVGGTVTARDYSPDPHCGNGLHFCPTVEATLSYAPDASRFLACAVDVATMSVISDYSAPKAKARSCRVLYEVGRDGKRLPRRQ